MLSLLKPASICARVARPVLTGPVLTRNCGELEGLEGSLSRTWLGGPFFFSDNVGEGRGVCPRASGHSLAATRDSRREGALPSGSLQGQRVLGHAVGERTDFRSCAVPIRSDGV